MKVFHHLVHRLAIGVAGLLSSKPESPGQRSRLSSGRGEQACYGANYQREVLPVEGSPSEVIIDEPLQRGTILAESTCNARLKPHGVASGTVTGAVLCGSPRALLSVEFRPGYSYWSAGIPTFLLIDIRESTITSLFPDVRDRLLLIQQELGETMAPFGASAVIATASLKREGKNALFIESCSDRLICSLSVPETHAPTETS